MLSPHFYGMNPGLMFFSPPVDTGGWIAGLRLIDLSAVRGGQDLIMNCTLLVYPLVINGDLMVI